MYKKLGYHILYSDIAATIQESWGSEKSEIIEKNTSDLLGVPYY